MNNYFLAPILSEFHLNIKQKCVFNQSHHNSKKKNRTSIIFVFMTD